MLTFLALLVGVFTLFVFWMLRKFKYWENKNVPSGKVVPFFGDNYDACMGKVAIGDALVEMYNKVPGNHRYVGGYQFFTPILVLRTPELIKQLCVKDCEHFVDHSTAIMASEDDLFQKALFPMKGQAWKDARTVVSPMLNGNKVKLMFPLIGRHVKKFVEFVKEKNEKVTKVDFKDATIKILNDLSSDTALGIDVNSFRDPDNIVYKTGLATCDLTIPYKKLYMLLYSFCPSVSKFFGLSLFPEGKDFFPNIVRDAIKLRKEKGIKRADMIGLLLDIREEQMKAKAETGEDVKVVTVEEMASYVFVMYFGVLDSVTTSICFLAWELAMAPEIQDKLRKEVDNMACGDEDPSYQDVGKMQYVEMVVNEILRKWPPVIATDRSVTKPYTIKPELPHEKEVHLDVGDCILLPVYAIHRDPKYYENPEVFDPERFAPENKHKIDPNAFLPFGIGPRVCVGSRLAMVMMKIIVYHLIKNFEFVPVENTPNPLVMDKEAFALHPVGGFHFGLKRRD